MYDAFKKAYYWNKDLHKACELRSFISNSLTGVGNIIQQQISKIYKAELNCILSTANKRTNLLSSRGMRFLLTANSVRLTNNSNESSQGNIQLQLKEKHYQQPIETNKRPINP